MILKIKAWIYRNTGIYLAHREENEYVESKQFWKVFRKLMKNNEDLGPEAAYGILVGAWQSEHGFYRTFNVKRLLKKKS